MKTSLTNMNPETLNSGIWKDLNFMKKLKKAYAIIATGETALYANIILKKGVVIEG